jgi:hypothetical protein
MIWCLMKYKDNFTFTFYEVIKINLVLMKNNRIWSIIVSEA